MTDRLEYKGYWYLPDNKDKKVAGILTFVPNDKIQLELFGSFNQGERPFDIFLDKKNSPIICGVTSDAKDITLINCESSSKSLNFDSTFPIIKYNFQYLIVGKHMSENKEKTKILPKNWTDAKVIKFA